MNRNKQKLIQVEGVSIKRIHPLFVTKPYFSCTKEKNNCNSYFIQL